MPSQKKAHNPLQMTELTPFQHKTAQARFQSPFLSHSAAKKNPQKVGGGVRGGGSTDSAAITEAHG